MKQFLLTVAIGLMLVATQQAFAQQGFGTNQPDRSAAVEIQSTKRGLLIPRLALEATNVASPVTSPANSLLVYNTATAGTGETAVSPGFYYWDADDAKWVRFIDVDSQTSTVVAAGNNVTVESTVDGNETTYTVHVAGGSTAGQVLVTVPNPDYDSGDPNSPEFISEWVTYEDFLTELLDVENGLTFDAATGKLTWGGDLTQATTIGIGENVLTFSVDPTNGGAFVINGLADLPHDPVDGYPTDAKIVVMDGSGALHTVGLSDFIASLTVDAENGLTYDEADNTIRLGGQLNRATVIATGAESDGGDAANTLAITGLEAASTANSIVVAEETTGILRTVERALNYPIASSFDIGSGGGYSPYVQEINVAAELGASNIVVTLPSAADATGQVINVRIVNTDENHDGEVQIVDGSTTLTYGAMPYQGWVIKSVNTGTAGSPNYTWLVVGRN